MNETILKLFNRNIINLNLFLCNSKPKTLIRGSRPDVFCKKEVLQNMKNFEKFKGKHLCQSLFYKKIIGLGSATLL